MGRFSELRKKAKQKKEVKEEPALQKREEEQKQKQPEDSSGESGKKNIVLPSSGLAEDILQAIESGKEVVVKEEPEDFMPEWDYGYNKAEEALIQLVVFSLGSEKYGIDIYNVKEIINPVEIVRVPRAQKSLIGVINLRGNVIPVFDFRIMFEFGQASMIEEETRLMIVESNERLLAFIVDKVFFVSKVSLEDIEAMPPHLQLYIGSEFISGVAKIGEDVLAIIDIEKLVNSAKLKGG